MVSSKIKRREEKWFAESFEKVNIDSGVALEVALILLMATQISTLP